MTPLSTAEKLNLHATVAYRETLARPDAITSSSNRMGGTIAANIAEAPLTEGGRDNANGSDSYGDALGPGCCQCAGAGAACVQGLHRPIPKVHEELCRTDLQDRTRHMHEVLQKVVSRRHSLAPNIRSEASVL